MPGRRPFFATLSATLIVTIACAACQSSPEEDSREQLIDLYLGNALLFYEGGRFPSSLAQVKKVLDLDPENQKARFVRAMSRLRLKGAQDVQMALKELEELSQEDFEGRQFRVWLGLGMARAAVGDYYDARFRLLERQIKDSPLEAPELVPRRETARKKRDRLWRASNEACLKVLSYEDIPVARNDPIALYHLYRNHGLLGEHLKALRYQERHLAVIEGSRKQWEKGIKEYPNVKDVYGAKLKGTRKNEVAVREAMAVTLNKLGRYPEAVNHLSRAIMLDPEQAKLYLNRAQVRRKQGKHAEAVLDLRRFIQKTELGPEDPDGQKAVELLRDSEKRMMKE